MWHDPKMVVNVLLLLLHVYLAHSSGQLLKLIVTTQLAPCLDMTHILSADVLPGV